MKSRFLAAVALIAPAGLSHAYAQPVTTGPSTPPVRLDTVLVTATPQNDDPPVVREARTRLSRTPGAVAVVAAETYENRYTLGMPEMMRDVPGVLSQKRYGEESRISIRGSGIDQAYHQRGVLFAQDGVPVADADGFGDFQKFDAGAVRYIEVFKGGNALRFGGAQLGGAINLVTPTGRTAEADNSMRLEGGSFGTIRTRGAMARVSGPWDAYGTISGLRADGFRDHSGQNQVRGTANLGYTFGADREVRLHVSGGFIRQDVPGTLTLGDALHRPQKAGAGVQANAWARDQDISRVALQTHWRFDNALSFEGALYSTTMDLHHPISIVIDQDSQNRGAYGRFDWQGAVGGHKADLYWGFSLRQGRLEQDLYLAGGGGSNGMMIGNDHRNALGADLFAEGRYFMLPELALVAGGSFGLALRDYTNYRNEAANASQDFKWFSPRLGLLWENADGLQVYANVTRSVEPPHFGALVQTSAVATGFVPINSQEAWTAEFGTRGRSGPLTWDLTYYHAFVRDELLSYGVYGLPSVFFNADRTVHSGIEAGLDWVAAYDLFGGRVTLRQTYNYSDFHFNGDATYGDNRLPVVPVHQYRAEVKYEHRSGFFIAPAVEWRPLDTFVDYANTTKVPGYAVFSLGAGYDITDNVTFYLDARNLAGTNYVPEFGALTDYTTAANTAVFYPGEGRAVFAGITARF